MSDSNISIVGKYIIENSNWAQRRVLHVFIVFLIIFLILGFYFYKKYQDSKIVAPSCNDKIMNQNEGGIDCEGECVKICREHMSEIKVLYAKAISSGYNTYDLVAMIENDNVGKIPSSIPYIFRVYNGIGIEMASSTGKLDIADGVKMPLIVPNIHINNSDNPATTLYTTLELGHYDMYPAVVHKEKVKVIDYRFDEDEKRLYVNLINSTLDNSEGVQVKVVISDHNGQTKAVGQTIVTSMASGEKRQATITWSESLKDILNKNNTVQIYIVSDTK